MAFPKRDLFPKDDQLISMRAFALSHPARLHILRMLDERPRYVEEIVRSVPLSQPAVSTHLRILRRSCLVNVVEEGRWNRYSVERAVLSESIRQFVEFGSGVGVDVECLING